MLGNPDSFSPLLKIPLLAKPPLFFPLCIGGTDPRTVDFPLVVIDSVPPLSWKSDRFPFFFFRHVEKNLSWGPSSRVFERKTFFFFLPYVSPPLVSGSSPPLLLGPEQDAEFFLVLRRFSDISFIPFFFFLFAGRRRPSYFPPIFSFPRNGSSQARYGCLFFFLLNMVWQEVSTQPSLPQR